MDRDSAGDTTPGGDAMRQALARERNLFRTLIDHLPDYVYAKDLESRFTLNNLAHLQDLGVASPEEAMGKTDFDFFPQELAENFVKDDRKIMQSGLPMVDREEVAVDQRGRKQWLLTTKVPVRDDQGQVSGLIGISRDITQLKAAERALQRRVELQGLIAKLSSRFINLPIDGVAAEIERTLKVIGEFARADRCYVLTYGTIRDQLNQCYEWCAPGVPSLTEQRQQLMARETLPWLAKKLSSREVLSIPMVEHLPPEARADREYLEGQGVHGLLLVPMSSEARLLGFLGIDVLDTVQEFAPHAGELMEAVGRIFGQTLVRRAHLEALDRERSFMDALMDNLPDAVYFKDEHSRFMRISRGFVNKHRITQEDAVGKSDFDLFTDEHAQQAYEDEQEIIQTDTPKVDIVEKETWSDRPSSWVSTTKMPFRDRSGAIVGTFGISRDITRQREMEESVAEHARLLEIANGELAAQNQELDEFSYIASHDLQEPLRKIIAFSDMLREDLSGGSKEDIDHDLDVLVSSAGRMHQLVQDLLALSRFGRQAMEIQKIDLNEAIDLALDALEIRVAEVGAEIVRAELPAVPIDKTLITQLFQNLIGNALKFIKDDAPRVEISAKRLHGGHWQIGVRDNGIGMAPEYAEQIFAPFQRLHGRSEYEGTGIGLAVCRKIVERHGGRIWVESALGKGAEFLFTLPEKPVA